MTECELGDEQLLEDQVALLLAPISAAFMVVFLLATMLERLHVKWFPESLLVILVGVALGAIFVAVRGDLGDVLYDLNPFIVNLIFLPIIIFESGWNLQAKDFASQFAYILAFAVIGTLVATMITGSLILASSNLHGITDSRTAFAYASLIAATDPVATLATYAHLKVDPLLHISVFGEATLNDAVAIVIFGVINGNLVWGSICEEAGGAAVAIGDAVGPIILGIIVKFFGSLGLGIAFAITYTLTLRVFHMRHSQALEILFVFFCCYLTFFVAEIVGMSGIIAVLFCSILMGIYVKPHLSAEGCVLAAFFIRELAVLADTSIFMLIGINCLTIKGNRVWVFFGVLIVFLLFARGVAIVSVSVIVDAFKWCHGRAAGVPKSEFQLLTWRHIFMMWHAGLRGGIALILTMELGAYVDENNFEGAKHMLISTTMLIIVAFLAVFGGSTSLFLKLLKIPTGVKGGLQGISSRTWTAKTFSWLNRKIMHPLLRPSEHTEDEDEALMIEYLEDLGGGHARGTLLFRSSSVSTAAGLRQRSSSPAESDSSAVESSSGEEDNGDFSQ